MASVLWAAGDGIGRDRATWEPTPGGGHRLAGTALVAVDGAPFEIRYSVGTDDSLHTRSVGVHVRGPDRDDAVALTADGDGAWSGQDGRPLPFLEGCLDVDLEFTPASNTLAIGRLGLFRGESADIDAAWVRFPERRVDRIVQRYARVGNAEYRYSAANLAWDVTVHPDLLVERYGDLWHTLARG